MPPVEREGQTLGLFGIHTFPEAVLNKPGCMAALYNARRLGIRSELCSGATAVMLAGAWRSGITSDQLSRSSVKMLTDDGFPRMVRETVYTHIETD